MNGGPARNNFDSVAQAIQKKYPTLIFHHEGFAPSEGAKKLNRVEQLLAQKKPVIVSIANAPSGGKGWHIMPIVDATSDELILLEYVDVNGNKRTKNLKKEEFVRIHDNYAGGDDIAFLGDPKVASPSS